MYVAYPSDLEKPVFELMAQGDAFRTLTTQQASGLSLGVSYKTYPVHIYDLTWILSRSSGSAGCWWAWYNHDLDYGANRFYIPLIVSGIYREQVKCSKVDPPQESINGDLHTIKMRIEALIDYQPDGCELAWDRLSDTEKDYYCNIVNVQIPNDINSIERVLRIVERYSY